MTYKKFQHIVLSLFPDAETEYDTKNFNFVIRLRLEDILNISSYFFDIYSSIEEFDRVSDYIYLLLQDRLDEMIKHIQKSKMSLKNNYEKISFKNI